MNPSRFNGLGILIFWTHTRARLGVNKPHIFTVESWSTRNLFSQDQMQLTSTYLGAGIRNRWGRGRKWVNERTSIVSLCNLTKEALWKESTGRIHTLFPCLCALILCSFVFPFCLSWFPSLCNSMHVTVSIWICVGIWEWACLRLFKF